MSLGYDLIFFGYKLRSGIARSYGSYIFNFLGTSIPLFIMTVPVCIPTKSSQVFSLIPQQYLSCLSDNSNSNRCEVTPPSRLFL